MAGHHLTQEGRFNKANLFQHICYCFCVGMGEKIIFTYIQDDKPEGGRYLEPHCGCRPGVPLWKVRNCTWVSIKFVELLLQKIGVVAKESLLSLIDIDLGLNFELNLFRYGRLGDVYIPRERGSGEHRGFAFVRFVNKWVTSLEEQLVRKCLPRQGRCWGCNWLNGRAHLWGQGAQGATGQVYFSAFQKLVPKSQFRSLQSIYIKVRPEWAGLWWGQKEVKE